MAISLLMIPMIPRIIFNIEEITEMAARSMAHPIKRVTGPASWREKTIPSGVLIVKLFALLRFILFFLTGLTRCSGFKIQKCFSGNSPNYWIAIMRFNCVCALEIKSCLSCYPVIIFSNFFFRPEILKNSANRNNSIAPNPILTV